MDMEKNSVIGLYYIEPSRMCRSASPIANGGYGIIDHGYQDSGIGKIGSLMYFQIAKKVKLHYLSSQL